MSMATGNSEKASAEINVTPLIDVLLVLLIIFMVIIPHQRRGETAEIPTPNPVSSPIPETPNPIVIELTRTPNGEIPELKINQSPVTWDTLDARLREIFQLRAERVAFVKSDPEIDFRHVAEALDIAHHAGVDRVGLMDSGSPKANDARLPGLRD